MAWLPVEDSSKWFGRRIGENSALFISETRTTQGASLVLGYFGEKEKERAVSVLGTSGVRFLPLDLSASDSIAAFAAQMRGYTIDVLLSSAGVCSYNRLMLAVNFIGTVRWVAALRPLLAHDARAVLVASDAHALGEIRFDDLLLRRFDSIQPSVAKVWPNQVNYGTTKLYLICYMLEYLRREPGLSLHFVQPGAVNTPMGEEHAGVFLPLLRGIKRLLFKTSWEGAQTVLHVAACAKDNDLPSGGASWANNALHTFVNKQCFDVALQKRFFDEAKKTFNL